MSLETLKNLPAIQERYFFRIPHAHIIADYTWPGLVMSPQRIIDIRSMKFEKDDILLVSYPKSGTTWMCELVSALAYSGDTDALRQVRQDERCHWIELEKNYWWVRSFYSYNKDQAEKGNVKRRRIFFTHLPLELLPKSALNGDCRIVYVARNPKDNAVSFYHYHRMTRFLGLQHNLPWNEFFALYMSGSLYAGSWFEHVLGFWEFAKQNSDKILFCKFEDMKKDLMKSIDSIAEFLDMKLEQELMEKVYNHCTFDSMKENPMANRNSNYLFNTNIGKFMRKGVVGDWKDYFTILQSQLFDEMYADKMAGTGLTFEFEQ